MTTLVANTFSWVGLTSISNWLKKQVIKLEARSAANATVKELSRLSDAELNDIGIARCDIRYLAEQHYKDQVNENLRGWV